MENKIALVVGGSGGIGSAIAQKLSSQGVRVIIAGSNGANVERVTQLINSTGGSAYSITVDVKDPSSVHQMVEEIEDEFGEIDFLINAFGKGIIKPIRDIESNEAKEVIDVNVFGTFLVTQQVLNILKKNVPTNVVMFPGTMGKYVMRNSSVYAATKFATSGFTKALIEELRREKVRFHLYYLGGVDTAFWDDENVQMKVKKEVMLTTDEVAESVLLSLASKNSAVINEIIMQPESHQMV